MDWDGGVDAYGSASAMSDELTSSSASTVMDLPSARKRKLFGSCGSGGGTNSPPRLSLVSKSPPLGRPLAGSKRARMAHSHPLARSASSSYAAAAPPTRQSPIQAPLQLAAGGGPTSYRQRSPSPSLRAPTLPRSISIGSTSLRQHAYSPNAFSQSSEGSTCVSCRRTATSVLQLSKFQRCALCGGMCCPVCVRTCQGATTTTGEDDESDLSASRKTPRHDSDARGEQQHQQVHSRSESPDLGNDLQSSLASCGVIVCRGCSSESHDGIAQCYRCSTTPPQ